MKIGDKLRFYLKIKNISIPKLEELTGLNNYQLKNILYNRSKNIEKIERISKALSVPINEIVGNIDEDFDLYLYSVVVQITCHALIEKDYKLPKTQIDELSEKVYCYAKNNNIHNKEVLAAFCEDVLKTIKIKDF